MVTNEGNKYLLPGKMLGTLRPNVTDVLHLDMKLSDLALLVQQADFWLHGHCSGSSRTSIFCSNRFLASHWDLIIVLN